MLVINKVLGMFKDFMEKLSLCLASKKKCVANLILFYLIIIKVNIKMFVLSNIWLFLIKSGTRPNLMRHLKIIYSFDLWCFVMIIFRNYFFHICNFVNFSKVGKNMLVNCIELPGGQEFSPSVSQWKFHWKD